MTRSAGKCSEHGNWGRHGESVGVAKPSFWCSWHRDTVEPYAWTGRLVTKTTLNLNDQLLRQAKGRATRDGITLTRFVEDALRARLATRRDGKRPFRMRLKSVKGDQPPNVDISNRDALYDVIDRQGLRLTRTP